jgi:HAD superfamily hydrolase (TIGR01509 family)
MPLRAVLFDLDDTLHDKSATLRSMAVEQFTHARLDSLGVRKSEWLTAFVELNNQRIDKTEVFARLQERFSLSPSLSADLLHAFDANLGKKAQPVAGAGELLAACKARGLKVGVVTNGRDAFQRSKVEGMGCSRFVDLVVTSGGMGVKKPDPRIFRACLDGLSVEASEAAFIGDDLLADIEPASRLGMQAIWKSAAASFLAAFSSESLYEIRAFLLPED